MKEIGHDMRDCWSWQCYRLHFLQEVFPLTSSEVYTHHMRRRELRSPKCHRISKHHIFIYCKTIQLPRALYILEFTGKRWGLVFEGKWNSYRITLIKDLDSGVRYTWRYICKVDLGSTCVKVWLLTLSLVVNCRSDLSVLKVRTALFLLIVFIPYIPFFKAENFSENWVFWQRSDDMKIHLQGTRIPSKI